MHRLKGPTAAIAVLLIGFGTAFALEHSAHHGMGAATNAEVRSADGRVTIPFRLAGNHVVIPITIQGTRLEVVLDTGMPMDGVMLYRNDKVATLDLVPEKGAQAHLGGAGSEKHVAADLVQRLTIDVESLRLTDATAIVAPPVKGFVPDNDGIIGATLFHNFAVTIDFDAMRVTLDDPKKWVPSADAVAVPLIPNRNFRFAEVVVLTGDGRRIPTKVVVDLGASHPISLNIGATPGIEAPPGAIRTILGRGLGGAVRGQVGRIAGLELGGLVLRSVVATFPDGKYQRPGGMDFEGGNLGTGVLKHFNVTFDYTHGKMYLSPNRGFDKPFEWDMSGIGLEPDEDGSLRVAVIVAGSPAEAAGIKIGDILSRVGDRQVDSRDLYTLNDQFRNDGEVLAITMTRRGKPLETTLRLKRLV